MSSKILFAGLAALLLVSCKKNNTIPDPDPVPVEAVLLKEITVPNLPSPYYHFAYDASGQPTDISFASGIRMYNVVYDNTRVSEVANNTMANKDRLQYTYDATGKVTVIRYIDKENRQFRRCFLTYEGDRLRTIEWERKVDAGFAAERTTAFVYQTDGNLLEMTDHLHPLAGQNEATYVSRFEQYDDKLCTDDFRLLHENDEHLVWLPGVRFQKNNARKLTHSGNGSSFTIDYTYIYNDRNAPLRRTGDALITSGPNAGQRWQVVSFFTYYS